MLKYKETTMRTKKYTCEIDCAACASKVESKLKENPRVKAVRFDFLNKQLTITSDLSFEEVIKEVRKIEDDAVFPYADKKRTYNVSIDCAQCALKVEKRLNEEEEVYSASYDFPNGKLTVISPLSDERIIAIAKEAEDDIIFNEGNESKSSTLEYRTYKIKAKADCAACALKAEEALKTNADVKESSFDFNRGLLTVTTTLTEAEIKEIVRKADDDISFTERKEKDFALYKIIASLAFFFIAAAGEKFSPHFAYIFLAAYAISGYDVLLKALKNIFKGRVFDENFLMSIATVGAVLLSSFSEAAAVMIFYQVGEYFQNRAVRKSRTSIADLMDLKSDKATVIRSGKRFDVSPEEISKGEIIEVKAGEKIALDGVVIKGESYLDTKALTGESVPVSVKAGDKVLSGSVNTSGVLEVEVSEIYKDSTVSRILDLVENSSEKKSRSEKFITKFSRYYTPAVVAVAVIIAILPPLLGWGTFSTWIYRAMLLLVVSCPCALVLSVPLSYFASIGAFAKQGILVKGADSVQKLSKASLIAFDKTGTLTKGEFEVQEVRNYTDVDVLPIAAAIEMSSNHPIAKAISRKAGKSSLKAEKVQELAGMGIEGVIGDTLYKCGNRRLFPEAEAVKGTVVYVGTEDELLGYIVISDTLKPTTVRALEKMRKAGVQTLAMLTGDKKDTAEDIAKILKLDVVKSELLPDDKITAFESLMVDGKISVYAGDGINDAPTLTRADVGIAMGGVGSDAAIEAADCVIMSDDLEKIPAGILIAKKTERIVKQNIAFALGIKFLVIILSILGITNMWLAIFADVGVSLIAVLNAMRCLSYKEK